MMKKLLFLIVFVLAGTMLHAQWIPQVTGFPLPSVGINYISAVDANVVWALGYDGSGGTAELQVFTRTNNGGTTWTAGSIPGYSTYGTAMINALDYNTAWVPLFGPNGGGVLMKTSDGGATWVQKNTGAFPAPDGFPNVVHFFNANDGFCMGDATGGYFEIYTTTDGGETWTRVPSANIPAPLSGEWGIVGYYSVVGDNVWFGTQKSRVYKSTDKGLTWTVSSLGVAATYIDVAFLTATHGIAIDRGQNATALYETMDGGTTWTLIPYSGPYYTNDFAWVPGTTNTCVCTGAATNMSGCSYSYDGGHTWTEFNGTNGVQFLETEWVNTQTGWAGDFTDATTPSTLGGMYKYNGNLTEILAIDPKEGGISIYPNPGNGNFNFAIAGFQSQDVQINIYNMVGQKVFNTTTNQNLISYNQQIDLSTLGQGSYIAEIQAGNKIFKEKLVIR
ncbi:MAG TPA: T9SS type A sorting domain-containing protein [Bacteroidales bacterium]|nr:T9SS type A sorting domain-containing protein [Bacteroidales bacterium]